MIFSSRRHYRIKTDVSQQTNPKEPPFPNSLIGLNTINSSWETIQGAAHDFCPVHVEHSVFKPLTATCQELQKSIAGCSCGNSQQPKRAQFIFLNKSTEFKRKEDLNQSVIKSSKTGHSTRVALFLLLFLTPLTHPCGLLLVSPHAKLKPKH